ncbi:MAG: sensor histidine kinase [Sporichthya sp.]|nr:sensor histidine kinase [Sporichthya sp.]
MHTGPAAARGVRLRRTGADRFPLPIDGAAVFRAVDALVDNAVRYSPAGADVVVDLGAEDGVATVSVTDRGPGIPAADQPRILERYWTTAEGHSGIGLALVAQVAAAHQGLRVESPLTPEGGTRMSLRFGTRPAGSGSW